MPMLRKDPIAGRWVIIAAERAKRPRDYTVEQDSLHAGFCPFCAGQEASTPDPVAVYPADESSPHDWSVRVIPNKFPALSPDPQLVSERQGIYESMAGVGAHEVIIECPEHVVAFDELGADQMATVLQAWQDRIDDLRNDERLACAVVFKNHGAAAGASLEHAHSQLIALPIVPKRLDEELAGTRQYHAEHDRCVWCDIIDQETTDGSRIVCQNDVAVAMTPFASRFPFELCILPRDHGPWYEEASGQILAGVAALLEETLAKLNRALDNPPFNLMLHSAPFPNGEDTSHYHWHFELIPKLTKVAGFEWGTGFYINPTSPEAAAEHLREIALD